MWPALLGVQGTNPRMRRLLHSPEEPGREQVLKKEAQPEPVKSRLTDSATMMFQTVLTSKVPRSQASDFAALQSVPS